MPRRRLDSGRCLQEYQPRTRTRTGCQTCRLRKIKCDEGKPVCKQCRAKGLRCGASTLLKWEADYRLLGLAHGRQGIWGKRSAEAPLPLGLASEMWCEVPDIFPWSFVNSTVDGAGLAIVEAEETGYLLQPPLLPGEAAKLEGSISTSSMRSPPVPARGLVNSLMPSLKAVPSLHSVQELQLLDYYVAAICPLTAQSTSSSSPFATLILPFSMTVSPVVLDSIMALAACHRSRHDAFYQPLALKLSNRVLHRLRTSLHAENSHRLVSEPETLLVMMVLCLFEIVNRNDERWVVHLKGARDLIRIRRQCVAYSPPSASSKELFALAERFFAYSDVIGRTACGEEPIFGADFWTAQGTKADAFLGCSPELVAILCEITELSRQHRCNPCVSSSVAFQVHAAAVEYRIGKLEQEVPDLNDDTLRASAELKRTAAGLYLHCALYGASPSMPIVHHYVRTILELASFLLQHKIVGGLAWPLFVAAVELDPLEELQWTDDDVGEDCKHARPFVLQALNRMEDSVSNVTRTRFIIQTVWQNREMEELSDSTVPGLGEGRFDWERHVAPLCHGLSLF